MGRRTSHDRLLVISFVVLTGAPSGAAPPYSTSILNVELPDVTLIDQDAQLVKLRNLVEGKDVVMVDFIFGTCTTICPILSAGFSNLQRRMGSGPGGPTLISFSIDPEHDSPEVMTAYLKRYRAQPGWSFLTGDRDDIDTIMRAFDAYVPNKMSHQPVTFIKGTAPNQWVKIDGLVSTADLISELEKIRGGESMATRIPCAGVLSLVAVVALFSVAISAEEEAPAAAPVASHDPGWRMYHEGINPDGEPMQAIVQGDIPVDGTMFTCASCHLRSGLGSLEGSVITLPTNWGYLKRPLVGSDMSEVARERLPKELQQGEFRSAYDDKSLSRAIRMGKDPNGREFDLVMPRYALDKAEMDTLIAYLKVLSDEVSPGVDGTTMHFGTVIAGDVVREDEEAMLTVLRAIVRDHNSQTRHEDERRRRGPYYKQEKWDPYRRWELHPWRLEGDPEDLARPARRPLRRAARLRPARWHRRRRVAPGPRVLRRDRAPQPLSDHRSPGDFGQRLVHRVLLQGSVPGG